MNLYIIIAWYVPVGYVTETESACNVLIKKRKNICATNTVETKNVQFHKYNALYDYTWYIIWYEIT